MDNERETVHTGAALALLALLDEFERDIPTIEGYRPAVFRRIYRLRLSIIAGRLA
jgi:hypothetical protein